MTISLQKRMDISHYSHILFSIDIHLSDCTITARIALIRKVIVVI